MLLSRQIKVLINGNPFAIIYQKLLKNPLKEFKRTTREKKLKNLKVSDFLYRSSMGFKIMINKNKVVESEFYLNNFESEYLKLFRMLVKKGDVIIDAGANVGLFSLVAASKYNNKGKIYAFEPASYPFAKLKQNLLINNFRNIFINNSALGEYSGTIKLNVCEDDAYNSIGTNPHEQIIISVTVPITTIDEFCQVNDIKTVDILKMDTEGAEYLILKGAKSFIRKNPIPIIFTEYNREVIAGYKHTLADFENILIENNYEIFEVSNGNLSPFISSSSKSSNLICFHKDTKQKLFRNFKITH